MGTGFPVRGSIHTTLAGPPAAGPDDAAETAAKAPAAAEAGAAAVAAAVAGVEAVAGDYWTSYDAAFAAARPIFEKAIAESTAPKMVAIRELAAAQWVAALDLLDRMIRPEVSVMMRHSDHPAVVVETKSWAVSG